jgi:hypothetical protein
MKRVAFAFLFFFLTGTAFPQEISSDKVPAAVKQSFSRQFPSAKAVQYGIENSDYKIVFLKQEKQCIVTYSNAGKWLGTDTEIAAAALPKEVSASVAKNFAGYTVITAVKREALDMGMCFEMDLKRGDTGYSVRFSDTGEVLMKEPRKVEVKVTTRQKK